MPRKRQRTRPARAAAARREQGIAAIEFAMIAPVLIAFLFSVLELGTIMFISMTMDSALATTSRLGRTGYSSSGQSVQQTITATLNQELGSLLDTSQISITTKAYGTLGDVGVTGKGTDGTGTQNQFVVYTVSYPWHLMTPTLKPFLGQNGIYTISVSTMVENEPYGGS